MTKSSIVTIDFKEGVFLVENNLTKKNATVSIPMLQNRKHFTSEEKILRYLKKSVKCSDIVHAIIEPEATIAIELIVKYNKLLCLQK